MATAHADYVSAIDKETKRIANSAPSSKSLSPKTRSPTHHEFPNGAVLKENFNNKTGKENTHFLSEMEKLEYGAVGRKLPRLKLGRGRDGSSRTRHVASLMSLFNKAEDDPELAKVEDAKDRAIAEAKRLGEEARKAQLEVHRLTEELEELKREQAVEMNTQSANPTALGGKRWDSEKLTIRFDNKVLKPSDYTMDVQDKGSKIAINLHINGAAKSSS